MQLAKQLGARDSLAKGKRHRQSDDERNGDSPTMRRLEGGGWAIMAPGNPKKKEVKE